MIKEEVDHEQVLKDFIAKQKQRIKKLKDKDSKKKE